MVSFAKLRTGSLTANGLMQRFLNPPPPRIDCLPPSSHTDKFRTFPFISPREGIMNLRMFPLPFLLALAVHGLAQANDTDSKTAPLGKVSFQTSCDPKVQPAFERAVAMLHSFWFSAGEQAFRDVLKADPQCAIATWGIASILMNNALAGQGASPKGIEQAQTA